jgi:hypothetical protein
MKSLELYENYASLSSVWKNGMHSNLRDAPLYGAGVPGSTVL